MATPPPRRVLFVIRTKLGDTLIAFATIQAFAAAQPRDHVTLLVRKDYGRLFAREPGIRLVTFGSRIEMAAKLIWLRLTEPSFDVAAVLLGYGPPMRMIARLVAARRRLFFDGRFPDLYPEFPGPYREESLVDKSWQTARLIDAHLARPRRLLLPGLAAGREPGAAAAGPVAVVPLANELRRNFDRTTLAALLGWVRRRHPDREIWILMNPGDRGAADVLPVPLPAGVTTRTFRRLDDLGSLYRQVGAWYGTDTGHYHLAVAMGIPATVFFGPTQGHLIVMPDQPDATWIRLAVLGNDHCDEKTCARPLCLHQAVANFCDSAPAITLDETPAACPLRAHPQAALHENQVHEGPRHQA